MVVSVLIGAPGWADAGAHPGLDEPAVRWNRRHLGVSPTVNASLSRPVASMGGHRQPQRFGVLD